MNVTLTIQQQVSHVQLAVQPIKPTVRLYVLQNIQHVSVEDEPTGQVRLTVQPVYTTVALELVPAPQPVTLTVQQTLQQVVLQVGESSSQPPASAPHWARAVYTYSADVLTQKKLYADAGATQELYTHQYTYNGSGQLQQETITNHTTSTTTTKSFVYNPDGDIIEIVKS